MKTIAEIEEVAEKMQREGCVWTQIGWVNQAAVREFNEWAENRQDDIYRVKQSIGYGIQVDFFSRIYGKGDRSLATRVLN